MAMKSAGISALPAVADTGFADDGDIPVSMKSYIGTAARVGYIFGVEDSGRKYFLPSRNITVDEAAKICANILGLEYDGSVSVSVGGASDSAAVAALAERGFIDASGVSDHAAELTRAQAAVMLASLLQN